MKTIDLIKAIKDGSYHKSMISPNDIEPGKIMGIRDFDVLKEIAIHRNDFEILRNTDTWPKRDDRQFLLGSMDRLCQFLRDIEGKTCQCALYTYNEWDPVIEAEANRIEIKRSNIDHYGAEYECVCANCHSTFSVVKQEVRFGWQIIWIKNDPLHINHQTSLKPVE